MAKHPPDAMEIRVGRGVMLIVRMVAASGGIGLLDFSHGMPDGAVMTMIEADSMMGLINGCRLMVPRWAGVSSGGWVTRVVGRNGVEAFMASSCVLEGICQAKAWSRMIGPSNSHPAPCRPVGMSGQAWRRRRAARPNSPVPNSAIEAGSGTSIEKPMISDGVSPVVGNVFCS
jgi:hypothetical protein